MGVQVNTFLKATDEELAEDAFGKNIVTQLQRLRKIHIRPITLSHPVKPPPNPPTTYTGGVDEDGLESISEYGTLGLELQAPSLRDIRQKVKRLVAELLFIIAPCLSFFLEKQQVQHQTREP